jgi:hypothetical protein
MTNATMLVRKCCGQFFPLGGHAARWMTFPFSEDDMAALIFQARLNIKNDGAI